MILRAVFISTLVFAEAATAYAATAHATINSIDVNGVGPVIGTVTGDVRVLRDELLNSDSWNEAADSYAAEHDRYYGVIHQATECFGRMFYEAGPSADELRARALPLIAQDSTRMLDHITSGPDLPINDRLIRRFFGEE